METVELRVHGVHGTSPATMLGVADGEVGQVAGDGLTGIYRTKDGTVPYRDARGHVGQRRGVLLGRPHLRRAGLLRLGEARPVVDPAALRPGEPRLLGPARARPGQRAGPVGCPRRTRLRPAAHRVLRAHPVRGRHRHGGLAVLPVRRPRVLGPAGLAELPRRAGPRPADRRGHGASRWRSSPCCGGCRRRRSAATRAWSRPSPTRRRPPPTGPSGRCCSTRTSGTAASARCGCNASTWPRRSRSWWRSPGSTCCARAGAASPSGPAAGLGLCVMVATLIMAVCVVGVCANHPKDVDWSGAYGEPNLVDLLGQRLGPRFDKGIALAAVATYLLHLLVLWTLSAAPHQHLDESIDYTWRNVWFISIFLLLTVLHLSVFTGGRMGGRTATAIALSPLVIVVVVQTLRVAGLYDSSNAWFILGCCRWSPSASGGCSRTGSTTARPRTTTRPGAVPAPRSCSPRPRGWRCCSPPAPSSRRRTSSTAPTTVSATSSARWRSRTRASPRRRCST